MELKYTAYHFTIVPKDPGAEILMAELAEKEFESFVETPEGLSAYVQDQFDGPQLLEDIYILASEEFQITFEKESLEQVNWNEEWEKNFDPIDVDGVCYVRAPFHEPKNTTYEIVIEPKMSFGTGHHETTFLMMKHILQLDLTGKTVLDMGCGTAILALLAIMKGAATADAIDIDHWCYLNSIENAERNDIQNINVYEGDASLLNDKKEAYDVVIANINRNILLQDIPTYVTTLRPSGTILFSGFYTEDVSAISAEAVKNGLVFEEQLVRNNWVALRFKKQ